MSDIYAPGYINSILDEWDKRDKEAWEIIRQGPKLRARIVQLEEEVEQARGLAEQNDKWEYIGVLEDRIGMLEAALVEEVARLIASDGYAISREPTEDDHRLARIELETSGILKKLQNGAK